MPIQTNVPSSAKKSGPPGIWDRDPLTDATGASLLIALPASLLDDRILVRVWIGASTRIGAPLVAELDLGGVDPRDYEVRAWLGHVGRWTLARSEAGAVMHCWLEEAELRHPERLIGYLEDLLRSVHARIRLYEGPEEPRAKDHAAVHRRVEALWTDYRKARQHGSNNPVPAELVELCMRIARHEARRLRPNLPAHFDQDDIEARGVLSVFDALDRAWRAESESLVPAIRRGVRLIVLDEARDDGQLSQEERALLGIDSLKVSLEDLAEPDEDPETDTVLRPSEPPGSNPRWTPCDRVPSATS
jgi:hypothetical protein